MEVFATTHARVSDGLLQLLPQSDTLASRLEEQLRKLYPDVTVVGTAAHDDPLATPTRADGDQQLSSLVVKGEWESMVRVDSILRDWMVRKRFNPDQELELGDREKYSSYQSESGDIYTDAPLVKREIGDSEVTLPTCENATASFVATESISDVLQDKVEECIEDGNSDTNPTAVQESSERASKAKRKHRVKRVTRSRNKPNYAEDAYMPGDNAGVDIIDNVLMKSEQTGDTSDKVKGSSTVAQRTKRRRAIPAQKPSKKVYIRKKRYVLVEDSDSQKCEDDDEDNVSKYKKHIDKDDSSEIYKCKHCSYENDSYRNIKIHLRRFHLKRTFACDVCGKMFGMNRDLTSHKRIHEKKFQCCICDKLFSNKQLLTNHEKKHHNIGINEDETPSENSTRSRCKGDKPLAVSCNECSFVTKKKRNLTVHYRRCHGEKTMPCPHCDKKFSQGKDLRSHLRRHGAQVFPCEKCGQTLRSKFALDMHIKRIHLGIHVDLMKRYQCSDCGKVCVGKTEYTTHVNKDHLNVRPFECSECGKAFHGKSLLRVHKRVHEDPKLCCPECGKMFHQRAGLKDHLVTHAGPNGPVNFTCDICHKGFTRKVSLTRHQRVHTGHKPYKCRLCNSAFSDYSILRRHVVGVHKIDDKSLVRISQSDDKSLDLAGLSQQPALQKESISAVASAEAGPASTGMRTTPAVTHPDSELTTAAIEGTHNETNRLLISSSLLTAENSATNPDGDVSGDQRHARELPVHCYARPSEDGGLHRLYEAASRPPGDIGSQNRTDIFTFAHSDVATAGNTLSSLNMAAASGGFPGFRPSLHSVPHAYQHLLLAPGSYQEQYSRYAGPEGQSKT